MGSRLPRFRHILTNMVEVTVEAAVEAAAEALMRLYLVIRQVM